MGLIRWAKTRYLKRVLRRVVKRVMSTYTEEEKMKIFESKEQWANMLTMAGSALGAINSVEVVAWFNLASEAASSGQLEVTLTCAVTFILGLSRFLGRLNRKSEAKEQAKEAILDAAKIARKR